VDADFELVERWRAGDQRAGQALFERHFTDVYRFLENKVKGEGAELVQRTFLSCVRARDQFRGQSSFRTYLFAIARHELYRYLRQLRDEPLDFEATSIAELVTTPATRLARARELEQLRAALAELPLEQQLVLELHYWHDLDGPALAEVFDVAVTTVRTKLFRARRALRDKLAGRLGRDVLGVSVDRLAAALASPESGDDAVSEI
jgi:RNA polymerase sigma factor (sigma-70 family)